MKQRLEKVNMLNKLKVEENDYFKVKRGEIHACRSISPPPMAVITDFEDNVLPRSICGSPTEYHGGEMKHIDGT